MSREESSSRPTNPAMQLMGFMWPGALVVQTIHVAASLRLADLVAAGPKTVAELAETTETHAPSLGRLLRALTSVGVFAEEADGRYSQTPMSDVMRSDHPQSMRRWALMLGAAFIWKPIGELASAVTTGQPPFENVFGARFFKHLAEHPDDAAVFNAAMSSMPAYLASVVQAYDFSPFNRIVDVGGGQGALLNAVLAANPRARGVLFDLPAVVEGVRVADQAVADRLEIVAGDFFESVPAGADAYVLKGVVHDWNDEEALRILRNCREAITPQGRLIILDTVLTGRSDPQSAMMDMLMLVLTGGRERTETEFSQLLADAGFTLVRVIPTMGGSILESRPAG
jgi:SAM-dependent methyltransferase